MRDYKKIVAALFAKAESTDSPEEAEALHAKAAELMAEHSIDMAMIMDSAGGSDVVHRIYKIEGRNASDRTRLFWGVAKGFSVKAVRSGGDYYSKSNYAMHVFGTDNDIDDLIELYERLEIHMTSETAKALDEVREENRAKAEGRYWKSTSGEARKFAHSFRLGYASRIGNRLRTVKLDAKAYAERVYGTERALPVLVEKDRLINDAVRDRFPHLTTTTSRHNGSGYGAGVNAANRASVGRGIGGGSLALGSGR